MKSKGQPVALVGPRGSGKTLVSRLLSRKLDLPLLDTDRIIAEEEKAEALYFVASGVVKVFKTSADGKEQSGGEDDVAPLSVPLVEGATVGTSSERRRAWLRSVRPDVELLPIRGNVPTRIDKLREGPFDAIILAAAGMARLQRASVETGFDLGGLVNTRLDPATFVPAPSQGAIAVQCRQADPVEAVLGALHDAAAAEPVRAERELLRLVDGGCSLPFGAWCRVLGDGSLEMIAALEASDEVFQVRRRGSDAERLADEVWRQLQNRAGDSPPVGGPADAGDGAGA